MMKKRLFYDEVTFTADTDDITIIQPRYIHDINLSLHMLQNGTTAPGLDEIVNTIDRMQIKLTGRIVTEMRGQDILAYNCLVEAKSPKYIISANDNENCYIEGLSVPLRLAPGEHVLSVRYLFNGGAYTDTQKLSFSTLESDDVLEDRHVEIPRFTFTPPSTGAYNTALDTSFAGDIHGFLLYSTTIPTATSTTTTVAKVRIKAGGDIVYEDNWTNMSAQTHYPEDSTLRALLDNYVYLDFDKAPIPAGTRIELEVYSDDTNPIYILPIQRV